MSYRVPNVRGQEWQVSELIEWVQPKPETSLRKYSLPVEYWKCVGIVPKLVLAGSIIGMVLALMYGGTSVIVIIGLWTALIVAVNVLELAEHAYDFRRRDRAVVKNPHRLDHDAQGSPNKFFVADRNSVEPTSLTRFMINHRSDESAFAIDSIWLAQKITGHKAYKSEWLDEFRTRLDVKTQARQIAERALKIHKVRIAAGDDREYVDKALEPAMEALAKRHSALQSYWRGIQELSDPVAEWERQKRREAVINPKLAELEGDGFVFDIESQDLSDLGDKIKVIRESLNGVLQTLS